MTGLSIVSIDKGYSPGLIVTTLVACLVGRAAHVYPLSRALNRHNRRSSDESIVPGAGGGAIITPKMQLFMP